MTNEAKYTIGYSKQAFSSHQSRTAEVDAAFLLPHIQPHFRILDVGCGPGTISAGLAKYVPQGQVVAIDISSKAIAQARKNAAALPGGHPSNLEFHCIDVLREPERYHALKHNSATSLVPVAESPLVSDARALPVEWFSSFDIIFESVTLVHLATPVKVIKNLKRFLKPGTGLFATRDYDVHTCTYLPDPTGICGRIGTTLSCLASAGTGGSSSCLARDVPTWLAQAGLPQEKMLVTGATTVYATPEQRRWWGESMVARFSEGDAIREGMISKSIMSTAECDEMRDALYQWSQDPAGWYFWTAIQVLAPLE